MSDFPFAQAPVTPTFVSTTGAQSPMVELSPLGSGSNPATMTWVANQAIFVPMVLPWPYPVRRVWWFNGSTVGANLDFGIYNRDGTRLFSLGSTAQGAASNPVYTDVTDFVLPEGRYYFALNTSGSTSNLRGYTTTTALMLRQAGVLQQAVGAVTLPTTMASAGAATQALYAVFGITRTASGF